MRGFILFGVVAMSFGCGLYDNEVVQPRVVMDQCLRRELFDTCMTNLPKGPESIHNSNDWSEVVDECNAASAQQSYRIRTTIKLECRSQ